MDSSFWFDTMNLEWSDYNFSKNIVFFCQKIFFTFTNSPNPDEMQHYAAFHLGLCCLPMYSFWGFPCKKGYGWSIQQRRSINCHNHISAKDVHNARKVLDGESERIRHWLNSLMIYKVLKLVVVHSRLEEIRKLQTTCHYTDTVINIAMLKKSILIKIYIDLGTFSKVFACLPW